MPLVAAFSLLVELASFLVIDLIRNRGKMSRKLLLRMIPGVSGIVLIVLEAALGRNLDVEKLLTDLVLVSCCLVMYPCSFEKPSLPFKASCLASCLGIAMVVFFSMVAPGYSSSRSGRIVYPFILEAILLASYFVTVAVRRFKGIRLFFRSAAVWQNVEDYARFLYSVVFLCLCLLSQGAMLIPGDLGLVVRTLSFLMLMAIYAPLYLRAMTGRTFFLGAETEDRIKDMIKGNLRTSYIDKADENRKMNNLYRRVMNYMTEEKPYLDPSFCMNDLAEKVYSNKLYLSRTINVLSGRNFRQFINYYRIQYAIGLFRKDPHLKVSEAAQMSGFNSAVSFNMAFKVNMGKTPSEWLQEYIYG